MGKYKSATASLSSTIPYRFNSEDNWDNGPMILRGTKEEEEKGKTKCRMSNHFKVYNHDTVSKIFK